MRVLHPFEDIAKKVSGSARVFTLREIVDRHGAQDAGFFNIAELDNSMHIPEKLVWWSFAKITGDILPFFFTRQANVLSGYLTLPFAIGLSIIPGDLSDGVIVLSV